MTYFLLQGKRKTREVDDSIIQDVAESPLMFDDERAAKDMPISIQTREEETEKEQCKFDQRNRMFQNYFITRKEVQLEHVGRPSVIMDGSRERVDIAFTNLEMQKLQETMINQRGELE